MIRLLRILAPGTRGLFASARTVPWCLVLAGVAPVSYAAQPTITVHLEDWATVPASGLVSYGFARPNFLRGDPADPNRVWLNDVNGRLYIIDKTTKSFTTLLDFNGSDTNPGLFDKVLPNYGFAMGLTCFQFDPEYAIPNSPGFGKFYTIHTEDPALPGSSLPDNTAFPGFNTTGYTNTTVFMPPNDPALAVAPRDCVLIEWTDTNVTDATFTGTARELLRTRINFVIHPMGDLVFNPLATSPSDPDYRCLYITHGDGADGETNDARHGNPQNLGAFTGKILRIIPDLGLHTSTSSVSSNGRYRIPNDNPFVGTSGALGEVWAYGFRNPHRMSWDPATDLLIVTDIGYDTWEEVNVITKGGNYGYADNEGNQVFHVSTGTASGTPPTNAGYYYPAIELPHSIALGYADAISSGFVYRGSMIPALQGKYVFADITTGTLFYCNPADLAAAHDQDPATLASFGRIYVQWDNPHDAPGLVTYTRLHSIVEIEYHARGGTATHLPGGAPVTNSLAPGGDGGRADIRWAVDGAGELYILSKSDGMIRAVVPDFSAPAFTTPPASSLVVAGNETAFTVAVTGYPAPALQWQRKPAGSGVFSDLANNGTYSGIDTATLTVTNPTTTMNGDTFRCVATNSSGSVTSDPATSNVARSQWHLNHFTLAQIAADDPAVIGDDADPEHDGLKNLLEYAFDLDPWTSSVDALPQAEVVNRGTEVRLQFTRLRGDIVYTVEASTDLETWDDDIPDNPDFEVQTAGYDVTATYQLAAVSRAFLRVVVAREP